MIQARGLTRRYGPALAVDHLTFDVLPGGVTGFLGPNGAGKSTTMRLVLGLDRPTAETVTVGGRPYRGGGAGATPAELRSFVRERVAPYKYPRQVWLMPDLPKGPTGKIVAAKYGLRRTSDDHERRPLT